MKICVKKIQCPSCQQMVKCREESSGGNLRVICPRCNKLIYVWNGVSWRGTYRPS